MCVVSEVILTKITDAHVILSGICHVKGELKLLVHLISSSDGFYFYNHDEPESTSLTHWVDNTASKVDLNYQKKGADRNHITDHHPKRVHQSSHGNPAEIVT